MKTVIVERVVGVGIISRYVVDQLVHLDEIRPGLLRKVIGAPTLRKTIVSHVICALKGHQARLTTAVLEPHVPTSVVTQGELAVLAAAIDEMSSEALMIALYGRTELVDLYARMADKTHILTWTYADRLFLKRGRDLEDRLETLMQIESVKSSHLQLVTNVTKPYLDPKLITVIDSIDRYHKVRMAVKFLQHLNPTLSEEEVLASLLPLGPKAKLRKWLEQQCSRGRFSHLPDFGGDARFRAIETIEELKEVGKERISLDGSRNHITHAALGMIVFVEYLPRNTILRLRAMTDGAWYLEHIYCRAADVDLAREILEVAKQVGWLLPQTLCVDPDLRLARNALRTVFDDVINVRIGVEENFFENNLRHQLEIEGWR